MKATAGTWDPEARPVYFTAITEFTTSSDRPLPHYLLIAANELLVEPSTTASRKAYRDALLPRLLDAGHEVLLDSGIFHASTHHAAAHGLTMDQALALPPEAIDGFARLHDRYLELTALHGDRLWGYIELDQGGATVKVQTRAKLEAHGLAPIPVYHPLNDGWDYFDQLAEGYDRICLGNIVKAPRPARLRIFQTIWQRHRAHPALWIHGLGLAPNEFMHACPLDSCDSSDWTDSQKYGNAPFVLADLAIISTLPDLTSTYRHGERESWLADSRFGCYRVDEANRQWRTHAAETAALGIPPYPAYLDQETPPCPARSA